MNIPARRVVIADLSRYDVGSGMNSMISVLDYRQMAGRAGRPQYDDYGEAVLVPPSTYQAEEILDHFTKTPPEPIESRLGGERGMRVHLLAAIAGSFGASRKDIDGALLQDAPRGADRRRIGWAGTLTRRWATFSASSWSSTRGASSRPPASGRGCRRCT